MIPSAREASEYFHEASLEDEQASYHNTLSLNMTHGEGRVTSCRLTLRRPDQVKGSSNSILPRINLFEVFHSQHELSRMQDEHTRPSCSVGGRISLLNDKDRNSA